MTRQQAEQRKLVDLGLQDCCKTHEGRRFLWDLLSRGNLFSPAFSANALQTAFNCGRQALTIELLDHLNQVAPDAYLQMLKENADVQRTYDARLDELNASLGGAIGDSDE